MKKSPLITSLEDAEKIVHEFIKRDFLRFKISNPRPNQLKVFELSRDPEAYKIISQTFQDLSISDQISVIKGITTLQMIWRQKTHSGKDHLVSVNPNGSHSDHVVNLINGQTTIKKNLNVAKQNKLFYAIWGRMKEGEGTIHNIVYDDCFMQTAMALFVNDQISRNVFETLQGYYQLQQPYHSIKQKYQLQLYSILDEKGEFTSAAMQYLLPNINGFMKLKITYQMLENFKLILQAFFKLYPSENNFCMVKTHFIEVYHDELGRQLRQKESTHKPGLAATLFYEPTTEIYKIQLSSTARDAIRLACFDFEDVVPSRVQLGILTTASIYKGGRLRYRPKIGAFPGVPNNAKIHDFDNVPPQTKADHDDYHADVMSRIGATICNALDRCVDLAKTHLLRKVPQLFNKSYEELFSKAVWTCVDKELSYFSNENYEAPIGDDKIAQAFGDALIKAGKTNGNFTFFDNNGVTDFGILCFIDMVQKIDEWYKFKFHPELMTGAFQTQFNFTLMLKPYLHPTDVQYNILLYRLAQQVNINEIAIWKLILDESYPKIIGNLGIKRNNLKGFLGLVDHYQKIDSADFHLTTIARGVIGFQNPDMNVLKMKSHDAKVLQAFLYLSLGKNLDHQFNSSLDNLKLELINLIDHNQPINYTQVSMELTLLKGKYASLSNSSSSSSGFFSSNNLSTMSHGLSLLEEGIKLAASSKLPQNPFPF